ncbi:hypothetical protein JVU11DRAFT_3407 [Chiua virens]|nr:hypothetical protein JVU11DRAFT_3407 [Chiua virens]
MFSSLFSIFSALFVGLAYSVNAAPIQPTELIAFAPNIIAPARGDIWPVGSQQKVAWSTDNIPSEAQNYTVVILLGYFTFVNNTESENLDIAHPLATQVPIMSGMAMVTVPLNATLGPNSTVAGKYPARHHIHLFCTHLLPVIGDSGDVSPPFTISAAA